MSRVRVVSDFSARVLDLLTSLYGENAKSVYTQIENLIDRFHDQTQISRTERRVLSHSDAFLITYADQVQAAGVPHLQCLADFCRSHLLNIISAIHILPFYPYSSDDGFSVIDYREVNSSSGTWNDVALLHPHFSLMFDIVLNHVSAKHRWFHAFLQEDPRFKDYFIVVDGTPDLSEVVRPRTLPLLTEFVTSTGRKKVWTTFSEDQIDLNFSNPAVLVEMLELMLFYVVQGADFLRLDAVAYLWKEIGTSCIHLPQTHSIIRLLRAVLDQTFPDVALITETNVPHVENITYFGDGNDEAQMVYNFALPPLVLHTIQSGNSHALSRWADSIHLPYPDATFFNFLASHDGIGINPVRGILAPFEIDALVNRCVQHGGLVSYKRDTSGAEIPYELNINYFDALSDRQKNEPLELQVDRFIAAHAILLSLIGVPALYFHSLFGSRSWLQGPLKTGMNRSINREKLFRDNIEEDLSDRDSLRFKIFTRIRKLIRIRSQHPAFDPYGHQEVRNFGNSVFALLRWTSSAPNHILTLQNVTPVPQPVVLSRTDCGTDLLQSSKRVDPGTLVMAPYEVVWIQVTS